MIQRQMNTIFMKSILQKHFENNFEKFFILYFQNTFKKYFAHHWYVPFHIIHISLHILQHCLSVNSMHIASERERVLCCSVLKKLSLVLVQAMAADRKPTYAFASEPPEALCMVVYLAQLCS